MHNIPHLSNIYTLCGFPISSMHAVEQSFFFIFHFLFDLKRLTKMHLKVRNVTGRQIYFDN